jgi:hypothetical protein
VAKTLTAAARQQYLTPHWSEQEASAKSRTAATEQQQQQQQQQEQPEEVGPMGSQLRE